VTDTIYAVSSGAPPAAIAVIRISGPKADSALAALAGRLPEPRRATLGELREGGELLDTAILLRFPGPASATGEDVAELHLHGGRAVIAAVTGALGRIEGLRAAEPGEFTRRAFDNGCLDLAEAEGLADLLTAETETQRRSAMAMAGGALSRAVDAWRTKLLDIAAAVEAELDFSDEDDVHQTGPQITEPILALANDMRAALLRPPAERLRDGVRVVMAGPPNAGKSSLFNALVQREAAITSAVAGTTRDVIEAPVSIAGLPLIIVDTAGLRDTADEVERIGVDRAREMVADADLVVWLGDPDDAPPGAMSVQTMADVIPRRGDVEISVSAFTGVGIDDLMQRILFRARMLLPRPGEAALNARHRLILDECIAALIEARSTADLLIVAEALRQARAALDRVTGRAGVEDMLDALFGRFCIGK
jgi:tRNA modification GTPase